MAFSSHRSLDDGITAASHRPKKGPDTASTSQPAGRQGGRSRARAPPSQDGPHKVCTSLPRRSCGPEASPASGTCFYFGQPCALLLTRDSISMNEKGRVGIWGLPASSAPHSNSSETCHLCLQSTVTCFRGTYHSDSAITFTYL